MTHVHLFSPRPISECLAPSFVIASVVPSPCMETDFSIDPTWKYVDTVIDMTSSRLSTPDNALNRTPQQQDPENPKKFYNGLTVTKRRRRRPGRPLLSFAQLAARKAARKAARRSKRKWRFYQTASSSAVAGQAQAKRPNGSSALERLPVELLERIFLYALDPNFCRASPFLASAVSRERIYRTLIRLAFFKDDEPSTVLPDARERIAEALKPADYKTLRFDEVDRANLQSTILKFNWCTKQLILAQLPALMGMNIQKHIIGAGIVLTHPEEQASLDELLHGQGREIIEGASLWDRQASFKGTAPDGGKRRMYITPLVSVDIDLGEDVLDSEVGHRVMSIRVIPDYLLRGRRTNDSNQCYFTEEDIDLLEIFRQEYGFDIAESTGHDVQFSTDALQSGMRTAIATRNRRALTSLLKVHEYFFRRRWETDPPPGCANQSPDRPYALPEEYFLQAIRLPMPDAMHFFMKLLRCNAESIPPNSSELTQWAMDLSFGNYGNKGKMTDDENDRALGLGTFLLEFMIDLPGYDDEGRRIPPDEELFYLGRLNQYDRMGRRIRNGTYGSSIADWGMKEEDWEGRAEECSFDVSNAYRHLIYPGSTP